MLAGDLELPTLITLRASFIVCIATIPIDNIYLYHTLYCKHNIILAIGVLKSNTTKHSVQLFTTIYTTSAQPVSHRQAIHPSNPCVHVRIAPRLHLVTAFSIAAEGVDSLVPRLFRTANAKAWKQG